MDRSVLALLSFSQGQRSSPPVSPDALSYRVMVVSALVLLSHCCAIECRGKSSAGQNRDFLLPFFFFSLRVNVSPPSHSTGGNLIMLVVSLSLSSSPSSFQMVRGSRKPVRGKPRKTSFRLSVKTDRSLPLGFQFLPFSHSSIPPFSLLFPLQIRRIICSADYLKTYNRSGGGFAIGVHAGGRPLRSTL